MTSFCGARQIEATTLARFSGDVIFRSEVRVVSSNVLIFFHDLRLRNLTLGAIFMSTWRSVHCRRKYREKTAGKSARIRRMEYNLARRNLGENRMSCRSFLFSLTFIYAIYLQCNRFATKIASRFVFKFDMIVVSIAVVILWIGGVHFVVFISRYIYNLVNFTFSHKLICGDLKQSPLIILCHRVIEMENLNDLGEYLNTEIVCTLAGLGYSEGSDYYKSPDCLGRLDMLKTFDPRGDSLVDL